MEAFKDFKKQKEKDDVKDKLFKVLDVIASKETVFNSKDYTEHLQQLAEILEGNTEVLSNLSDKQIEAIHAIKISETDLSKVESTLLAIQKEVATKQPVHIDTEAHELLKGVKKAIEDKEVPVIPKQPKTTTQNPKQHKQIVDTLVDIVGAVEKVKMSVAVGGGGNSTGHVENVAGEIINPSTEEKQDTLIDNQTNNTQKVQIAAQDSPSVDAFGRWRVSNPHTIFDTKLTHTNEPEFWDDQQTTGTGTTSTHSANRASVILAVSANTAGKRIRQTYARPNYQPGKSQSVTLTGILGVGESGLTVEIGDHDDENGLFFRNKDGVVYVVKKSFVTGSAIDTAVAQTDWNLDKLDGTGTSGITLDPTAIQIFLTDYQWLGGGRVRFGFDFGGQIIYVHEMRFSNIEKTVYMSNPSNPIRYSIENDGTAGAADMEQICCTIVSEGGAEGTGVDYWFSTGGTHLDANTANTIYALVGVKLQAGHKGEPVRFRSVSVLTQTNDDFEWLLYRNPTVAGTFTYANTASGPFQTAKGVTANTVTSGDIVSGGFGHSGTVESPEIGYEGGFGEAIDGTRDEFVLCVRPLSGNADIEGGITLQVNH